MKIKIKVNRKASDPLNQGYDIEFEISGSGTEQNPIVANIEDLIDTTLFTVEIYDAQSFLDLKLRDFGNLKFYDSRNITIQNSQFSELAFVKCENVILSVVNADYIKVENCKTLTLLNGNVRYVHVIAGFNLKIANSIIQKLVRERNKDLKIETSIIDRTKLKN